jgi:mannitol-1-/sugar-/sorbitol-6-/2-deoxyglucose-6-phosphatase
LPGSCVEGIPGQNKIIFEKFIGLPKKNFFIEYYGEFSVSPIQCLVFEDSFKGMIVTKAAGMKCLVITVHHQQEEIKWKAADWQLKSLMEFDEKFLNKLI